MAALLCLLSIVLFHQPLGASHMKRPPPSPPDLAILEIRIVPPRATPGQHVSISLRVANLGERGTKGPVEVRAAAKEGDWRERRSLERLTGGEERIVSFSFRVPEGVPGKVHFQFHLFAEEEPPALRNNNFGSASLTVVPHAPPGPPDRLPERERVPVTWSLAGVEPKRVVLSAGEEATFRVFLKPPPGGALVGVTVSLSPTVAAHRKWFAASSSPLKVEAGRATAEVVLKATPQVPAGLYRFRVELLRKGRPLASFGRGPEVFLRPPRPTVPQTEAVPEEIVVTLKAEGPRLQRALDRWQRSYRLRVKEVTRLRTLKRAVVLLEVPEDRTIKEVLGELLRDPLRPHAQPNYIYRSLGETEDPLLPLQHGLRAIGASRLHAKGITGKGIKVALIDTGVDYLHEDLRGQIIQREDLIQKGTFRLEAHGTALAGVIAARCGNGKGICGVAPEAAIMAVRACRPITRGALVATTTTFLLSQGLDRAISEGAQVINLSLGGPPDPLVRQLVKAALRRAVVIVAAAGDRSLRSYPPYPAALPEVIAVAAVDVRGNPYRQGVRGKFIDLCAPGVDIISTSPGDRYNFFHGTSMAAAFVSGAVALLLQIDPNLTPEEVARVLEGTSRDLGHPGRDDLFGWGLVQLDGAIDLVATHEVPRMPLRPPVEPSKGEKGLKNKLSKERK